MKSPKNNSDGEKLLIIKKEKSYHLALFFKFMFTDVVKIMFSQFFIPIFLIYFFLNFQIFKKKHYFIKNVTLIQFCMNFIHET